MQRVSTRTLVSAIVALTLGGASVHARTIQIDFGDDPDQSGEVTSLPDWNTVGELDESAGETASIADLSDSNGNSTGISLSTDTNIIGDSDNGPTHGAPPASNIFPDPVVTDYYYTQDADPNSDSEVLTTITFSGLDAGLTYDFDIFAGREGNTNDRTATYAVTGANSQSGTLNAAANPSQYLTLSGITPDANDQIALTLADNPDNAVGNFYINGVVINTNAVPEPATLGLLGAGGLLLLSRRRRGA